MRFQLARPTAALALAVALSISSAPSRAEPLITQGVGLSSCAKLGNDLKPNLGLDHPPNYLLFCFISPEIQAISML